MANKQAAKHLTERTKQDDVLQAQASANDGELSEAELARTAGGGFGTFQRPAPSPYKRPDIDLR